MDLSTLNIDEQSEQGVYMELMHPIDDEPLLQDDGSKITIKLLGADSKAFRDISKKHSRKRTANMMKTRKKDIDFTPTLEETCETLAACTVGWKGIEANGNAIKFSTDEAYKLYMDFSWIREQVNIFVGDRANFFTSK